MAAKKKPGPEDELGKLVRDLTEEILDWKAIHEYGCRDPFWPDGVNLNLVRNHCIYYHRRINEICVEFSLPLPDILTSPIPDEVDDDYMAPKGRFPDRLAWKKVPAVLNPKPAEMPEPMEPVQLCLEF